VETLVVLVVATLGCSGVLLMVVAVTLKMYRRWRAERSSAPTTLPIIHQPVLPVYDIGSLQLRLLGYVEGIQR